MNKKDSSSRDSAADSGRLAASKRVRRWLLGTPKLAADITSVTGETRERPNVFAVLLRLFFLLVFMVIVVGVACWLIFGMTILPTVRAGGHNWLVRTGAWTQGAAPPGTPAFVLPNPVQRTPLAKAERLISPSGKNSVVNIVAGPDHKVTTRNGKIVVDGVPTTISSKNVTKLTEGDKYFAVCQYGACGKTGKLLTIPVDRVLGEVVSEISLRGFTQPPTVKDAYTQKK